MNKRMKDAVAICAVCVILIVLAIASGLPARPAGGESAGSEGPAAAHSGSTPQPPAGVPPYMDQLGSSIATLADARLELLKRAAQVLDDADSLEAASVGYRDSIVQLRRAVAELREELGAEQANAIVGYLMMSQNLNVSQRVLAGELFGEM